MTDIVARSGRNYDVAQAGNIPAPRSEARNESAPTPRRPEATVTLPEPLPVRDDLPRPRTVAAPPRPTIEARRTTRPDAPVVRPEAPAARIEPPAPRREEPRREEPRREERREELRREEPRAERRPEPAASPAVPPARGTGWLSDLLARASRDDDKTDRTRPKAANAPAETIEALSLDIARMLDHAAVIDHWDRYQRGDRALFDRRLYTAQGQLAYEEIRRRYRSEREFRESVDRYVQEFERLLAEIGREDRDGTIVKSYLVSDTGKVYTLLAHASQRFE